MRKIWMILAAVTIIISAGAMVQAQTIMDRPEYRPSTDIYFSFANGQLLGSVYPIVPLADREFQLNILYQISFPNNDINQFNDYDGGGAGGYNFGDPESYKLEIHPAGAAIWFANLTSSPCTHNIVEYANWTISSTSAPCNHTILSGTRVNNKLVLSPQRYRSYDGEGLANEKELFDGALLRTDILSYTITDMGGGVGRLSLNDPSASPWEAASITGAEDRSISIIMNCLLFLMVLPGAMLLWRIWRK